MQLVLIIVTQYCMQAKDWQCHKGECKGIAMVRPNAPTPLMRLVVRALQKKSQQQASGKVSLLLTIVASHTYTRMKLGY